MNENIVRLDINGLNERYEFDKVARQASGAVMYRSKKAVLIATVAIDEEPVKEDFLPLTVQYIEKAYAAAKIPGGFIKRETKPGDFESLTSRLIDRSLRPLFPKGFYYSTVITVLVVSSDSEVDMQVAALHAANAALFVSGIPVSQNVAAVRVAKVDGSVVLNPKLSDLASGTLDLFVAGSGESIMAIEMRALASEQIDSIQIDMIDPMMPEVPMILEHQECNELKEPELVEMVGLAARAIKSATERCDEAFAPYVKELLELEIEDEYAQSDLYGFIDEHFKADVESSIATIAKSERGTKLAVVAERIMTAWGKSGHDADEKLIEKVLGEYKRNMVRTMILDKGIRADGRGFDEVRPISIETNLLPSVHGSCLFTRGETQVLVTATLGDTKDAQSYELITSKQSQSERFMVHYNFPGFSVGETKIIGVPGRREIGHGNLAKRALEPALDLTYKGTIRLVSEVLESNGSSSMATVCGGALALRSADINLVKLVAGVAMGMVGENGRHIILTDIIGLEDFDGDMDFKVTGTKDGITALQMDIKAPIDIDRFGEVLNKARKALDHILGLMEEADKHTKPSEALPSTEIFSINPGKIVDIIGKAGATIREIIERFEVSIDLDRDKGGVKLTGEDKNKVKAAKEHIKSIADTPVKKQMNYEIGKVYQGKVKKIVEFGVFVEMPDGYDALLHLSKISKDRVGVLADLYHDEDVIDVVVMEQKGKKVELATPEFIA